MKPNEVRIGYLLVTSPMPQVFIGGLMVVDGRGLPIEFRYSEPIQPNKIQQILYGSALNQYIKSEVILETLLKSLEGKPQLLIVNDDAFFIKEGMNKDFEIVRLMETKAAPLKDPGSFERISAQEFLLQLTMEASPIRVQRLLPTESREAVGGPKSLPDKSAEADQEIERSKAYSILAEVGRMMDILEPIKRVEKALITLCQEAGVKSVAS